MCPITEGQEKHPDILSSKAEKASGSILKIKPYKVRKGRKWLWEHKG